MSMTQQPAARRPDASMTLLTQVMDRPLDPGYAAAAERRLAAGEPASRGDRSARTLALLVLLGVLLTAAGLQTKGQTTSRVAEREQLVAEIRGQDDAAGRLVQRNVTLQTRIEGERARQLNQPALGGLADRVRELGLVTGALAVVGPGLRIDVDDAAALAPAVGGDPRAQSAASDGRVLDRDLQSVVNALWAVGAEAVSINGQRLTALSAIRSAGQAILVDYRPLSPPYRILAVGDSKNLSTGFSQHAGGRDLVYLADNFGIRYAIAQVSRLSLPASAGLDVRQARPAPTASPSPTSLSKESP